VAKGHLLLLLLLPFFPSPSPYSSAVVPALTPAPAVYVFGRVNAFVRSAAADALNGRHQQQGLVKAHHVPILYSC